MKLSSRLKRKLDWINTDTLFYDLNSTSDFSLAVTCVFFMDLKVSEINDIANFLGDTGPKPRSRTEAVEILIQALREKRNVEL